MSEWKEIFLRDVCTEISYGYTASATHQNTGVKFLRITDIVNTPFNWDTVPYCEISTKDTEKYKLYPGDIVIARTGATTGTTFTITDETKAVFASYLIRYKIDITKANPYFIGHNLKSEQWKGYVENIIGGSAQPGANAQQFADYELLLPPLPEQERIAEVLSSLDDKIGLLHRQNKTLEEMAETLFRLWLTKLKDRDLTTLGDYTKVQNGYAFKSNDFKDLGKNGVLKITNISFEQVDIHNTQFVDDIVVSNLSEKFVVFPKSFLIAMTGAEIGKIGIVGKTAKKLYINQRVGMLVDVLTNSSLLGYLFLKSAEGQDHIINTCTGSAQENISSLGIESMIVPQSTNDEVTEICESVNPLFEKIISNLEQIQHLETLRDTLLPKLMSGSVTVNEIA